MRRIFIVLVCLLYGNIYAQNQEEEQKPFDSKTFVTTSKHLPYWKECNEKAEKERAELIDCINTFFLSKIPIRHSDNRKFVHIVMQITENGEATIISAKGDDPELVDEVKKVGENIPLFIPAKKEDQNVAFELYFPLSFSQKKELTEVEKELTRPVIKNCQSSRTDAQSRFKNCLDLHVMRNFFYPDEAQEYNIQGVVIIYFEILEDASIDILAITGPHSVLKAEVERIFKKLEIETPALVEGKPIRLKFAYPVHFKLND